MSRAVHSGENSSGYNYVDAAGIASLPYAGRPETSGSAGNAANALPDRYTRSTAFQNSDDSVAVSSEDGALSPDQLSVPVPKSPVPPVPFPLLNDAQPLDANVQELNNSEVPGATLNLPESNPQPLQNMPGKGQPEFAPSFGLHDQSSVQPPRSLPQHSAGQAVRVPGPAPGMSGFRATVETDAAGWIGPYMGRTDMIPGGEEVSATPSPSVTMPADFSAWWDGPVQQRAGIAPRSMAVDVTSLVQQALVHSSQVQVLQADPEVQQRVVKQEEAVFDWSAFLDSRYDDLNDPIGNTLTTGNNDNRFKDHHVTSSGGVKRRTSTGGEVKLAQQFGYQDNNSRFLLPNPQSTSRMELSFRQPLLSRSGTVYNQNQIVLARIGANSSGDETLDELQKHLFSVAEAYWKLYRARAEFFQRQKLLSSARQVLATLEGRNHVDTIPRQILRARAAVARAESRMQRAVTDIRNAESQLRLLVNDPEMLDGGPVEFTPAETPCMMKSPVELRDSLQTALMNRPDISFAIRQMRASGVRMGVSKSEMLPKLDFIVSSYVAGLENQSQFSDSFNNQFTQGRPGYTVGMEFEVPLGNRAAKARVEQRQWELRRAISSFRATVETSLTEVEIANREVDTAWRELLGKYQAMAAAQNEVAYLQDRFEVLPMVEESSMLLLEDLLDGYERLADEEAGFSQAQTNYALSIIQLRRATGTMLRSRHDAPELENNESDWMASRAEQAASESDTKHVRAVSGRVDGHVKSSENSMPSIERSGAAPSDVGDGTRVSSAPEAPGILRAPALSSEAPIFHKSSDSAAAPGTPQRSRIGGHSFGNGF